MKKVLLILSGLIFTILPYINAATTASAQLSEVKIDTIDSESVRVTIGTDKEAKFHVFKIMNPTRLVIEVVDAELSSGSKTIEVDEPLIKRVRAGQFKSEPVKIARVVLDMKVDKYSYDEISTKNQIAVAITSASLKKEKKKADVNKKSSAKKAKKSSKTYKLSPNIQTEEHKKQVAQILMNKGKLKKSKKETKNEVSKKGLPKQDVGSVFVAYDDENMSVNFKEADVKEVINSFKDKIGKNIIYSDAVRGTITLKLKDVPFYELFDIILEKLSLSALVKTENIVEIVTTSEIPNITRRYRMFAVLADSARTTLTSLLTADEQALVNISIDTPSNSMIITMPVDLAEKIDYLISEIDLSTPQIMMKARLIEVTANNTVSNSVTWANTLNLSGAVQTVRPVKDMSNYEIDSTAGTIDSDESITNFTSGGVVDVSAVIDNSTLYGILNVLHTSGEAKTISEPTILAENNQAATIHVGRNLPVLTTQVTETGTTQSVSFIAEGIDLSITPSVSGDSDLVSMDVNVSVSELSSFQADNPVTSERRATTAVTVKSGNTIIIGGLLKERINVTKSGIPVLKDIPLVGFLFRNDSKSKERTELLIFLTPEILIN